MLIYFNVVLHFKLAAWDYQNMKRNQNSTGEIYVPVYLLYNDYDGKI